MVNLPPATRSPFGSTARARTLEGASPPLMPEPSWYQLVPSQRAMQEALTPPATVKSPPTTRSPLGSVSRACTSRFVPLSITNQFVPSHRAMLLAPCPPAMVNEPPATRSPLGNTAMARTLGGLRGRLLPIPEPRADQLTPSQRAMQGALTPPAVPK